MKNILRTKNTSESEKSHTWPHTFGHTVYLSEWVTWLLTYVFKAKYESKWFVKMLRCYLQCGPYREPKRVVVHYNRNSVALSVTYVCIWKRWWDSRLAACIALRLLKSTEFSTKIYNCVHIKSENHCVTYFTHRIFRLKCVFFNYTSHNSSPLYFTHHAFPAILLYEVDTVYK